MGEEGEGGGMEEQRLNEEFEVWKKNTPVLYDLVIYHMLEWPSLTVQWLPTPPRIDPDTSLPVHTLILGTHTSDEAPNFLMVADVYLPLTAQPSSSLPKVSFPFPSAHQLFDEMPQW